MSPAKSNIEIEAVSIPIQWDHYNPPPPTPANLCAVIARPEEVVLTFAFATALLTGTPQEQQQQVEQVRAAGGLKPAHVTSVVLNVHNARQLQRAINVQLAGLEAQNP